MNSYNFSQIWVSKIICSRIPFRIKNPILSSIIKLGLIPTLVFVAFYIVRHKIIEPEFLVAYIFALLWINLGPFFIWYYDEMLLPKFFRKSRELVPNHETLNMLAKKYDNRFSRKFWIIAVPWTIFILYLFVRNAPALSDAGIVAVCDFWFWVFFLIVAWSGLLTGIGFWGVWNTIRVVKDVSKKDLRIDPLHPDKLGGLSCVGYFAIGTTLLFSTGSLFLPLIYQIGNQIMATKPERVFEFWLGISIFSLFILLSFLYPTVKIHQKAKLIRNAVLDNLREKYNSSVSALGDSDQDPLKNAVSYLELNHLRNKYQDYKTVKLYPFEIEIFAKLTTSVILPFLFIVIQYYFQEHFR